MGWTVEKEDGEREGGENEDISQRSETGVEENREGGGAGVEEEGWNGYEEVEMGKTEKGRYTAEKQREIREKVRGGEREK